MDKEALQFHALAATEAEMRCVKEDHRMRIGGHGHVYCYPAWLAC
jgi:hypothetical protein